MAKVNPEKLTKNFKVRSGKSNETWLSWDAPVDLQEGEELIVVRRKDAFPVEVRNPNYEDRYTDVAQVEVFRGSSLYCSHLIPNGDKLQIGGTNTFIPSTVTQFDTNNKYNGRLIRDSIGQVFRIITNTDTEITFENISKNADNQVSPAEGAFVLLVDFTKSLTKGQTVSLLQDAKTLRVSSNTFVGGDKITLLGTTDLLFGTDWIAGVTEEDTATNIKKAIENSGVNYSVEQYGTTLLIELATEETLILSSNTSSVEVVQYAVSGKKIFTADGRFTKNQLRDFVLQSGITNFFIKKNEAKYIELYEDVALEALPNLDFFLLSNFNNTFTASYIDTYKSYLEALLQKGTGLEDETTYYYTIFTSKPQSDTILTNDDTDNYTVDKIDNYITRIFYEDIILDNSSSTPFSYNSLTGEVSFTGAPDLSSSGIQIGDLFSDSKGQRHSILGVSNLASGAFLLSTGLNVSPTIENALHGAVTRSNPPLNLGSVQVGDTFKDIAGNSFEIAAIPGSPLTGLTNPPSNSFDVLQGLTDTVIFTNSFLVPFTYSPSTSIVQYGERQITINKLLSAIGYNSISGILQYSGATIDLTNVSIGHFLVDGAGNRFEIRDVNHANQQLLLDTGLLLDNTVDDNRDGGVIEEVGFKDIEGNDLIDLTSIETSDLFKTNSKAVFSINSTDQSLGQVTLEAGASDISTIIETPFDGSVIRRGKEIAWSGFNNELLATLQSIHQAGVKRYSSVNEVQYSLYSNTLSTQAFGVSTQDRLFGDFLYRLFPSIFRQTDATGDLEDLMKVFGTQFNNMFSDINLFELRNPDVIEANVLTKAASSKGIDLTSENLGIDTRRRITRDIVPAYKLKGNREGIFKYIKILTTWDITNGTGDLKEAIIDDTPETTGLRLYSSSLGTGNTRYIDTLDVQSPPAGRFYKGIPGLTLPGFFAFKELIITLPNVAMEIGNSTDLGYFGGNTTLSDDNADLGLTNSLKDCFLIPNEGNPNDFYKITSNTSTTITVEGSIPQESLGAKYIVLSPLNMDRFTALDASISEFIPHDTIALFTFTLTTV